MTYFQALKIALRYNFQLRNFRQHFIDYEADMGACIVAMYTGLFATVCIPIAFVWMLLLPVRILCFAVFRSVVATDRELGEMRRSMGPQYKDLKNIDVD